MKCILIHRPGPVGTLLHIRNGLQLRAHEYLRTHWDSSIWHPQGKDTGPRTSSLLHFHQFWPLPPPFSVPSYIIFCRFQTVFPPSRVSVVLRAEKPLLELKGSGLVFCLSGLASRLPVCGGDWDAVDDAAAGSSFTLITPRESTVVWFEFLQPGRIFHIRHCECLLKPSPLNIWSNLHHMPLKGDEPTGRRASF